MRVGLIGHRSWIARHLAAELVAQGHSVILYEKRWTDQEELSWKSLDRMYLFAGRSSPNEEEMAAEKDLVARVLDTGIRCRVVYISSRSVWDGNPYGKHKGECERIIRDHRWSSEWMILRPPAVFGPGQPPDSPMLIPSLGRAPNLELKNPDVTTDFIHVRDLVAAMVQLPWRLADGVVRDFAGQFSIRPSVLRDLRRAWAQDFSDWT